MGKNIPVYKGEISPLDIAGDMDKHRQGNKGIDKPGKHDLRLP
ncbi:MAG: hypothetical protein BWY45_03474 [Euryarchaeota archaeon ADurb.Bin294]|nr:MAG: hypothetical protein BWY45_03474 [Euryarchaeota archaeon ADurb.Bin294]